MYITEAQLAEMRAGSYEALIDQIERAASAALQRPVRAVATWVDRAVVVDDEERFERVDYDCVGGAVALQGHGPYAVAAIGEAEVPRYVAGQVRALVRDVAEGRCAGEASRMRMRNLAHLIEAGERYWLVDAVAEIEAAQDAAWQRWYLADSERIRRRMWGEVRAREARVPDPATFAGRPDTGIPVGELRMAVEGLKAAYAQILDEGRSVRFDKGEADLDAIRSSLIGEAEAMVAALTRAERLMLEDVPRDVARMARAHGTCAERARHMVIVAGYLALRGRDPNEQGDGDDGTADH
jgi:hypothetical protein